MRRTAALGLVILLAVGLACAQTKGAKGKDAVIRGKTIPAWIKQLEGKGVLERVQAINALVQAGPEARKAAPALVNVFRDKDATFLHPLAAVALARIGPDSLAELQKGLADKSDAVRGGAALALGLIGPAARPAVPVLAKSLEDQESVVRFAAAQALGRIGSAAIKALPALRTSLAKDRDSAIRVEAAAALWKVAEDKRGLDELTKALADKSASVVQSAVTALAEMGTAAKPAAAKLKVLAEKEKDTARIQAAEAFARVGGDRGEALAVIEKELKNKNTDVRRAAISALGSLGTESAVKQLVALLGAKDATIRREAACALADRNVKLSDSAVKMLFGQLTDADPGVRWWSALALAAGSNEVRKQDEAVLRGLRIISQRVGEKETPHWTTVQEVSGPAVGRALAALVEVLKNRPKNFKREATRGLVLLGMDARPAMAALVEALKEEKLVRRGAAKALGQMGVEGLPVLTRLLTNPDAAVREGAARALGHMGLPARSAVKALTTSLKDGISSVRTQAALALWRIDQNSELALPIMQLVMKDVDNGDRWEAVEGIGIIAIEARPLIKGLLEVLLNAAKDRDAMVRVQGAIGLYRRSRKAREAALLIRDLISERDSLVRLKVVEALGEMGAEAKSVEILTPALEDKDVTVRLAVEEALARGGKAMVPDLINGLKERSPRVRAGIARALGMIGPDAKDAVKPLTALAREKNPMLKAVALEALRSILRGQEAELKKLQEINALIEDLIFIEDEVWKTGELLGSYRPRFLQLLPPHLQSNRWRNEYVRRGSRPGTVRPTSP